MKIKFIFFFVIIFSVLKLHAADDNTIFGYVISYDSNIIRIDGEEISIYPGQKILKKNIIEPYKILELYSPDLDTNIIIQGKTKLNILYETTRSAVNSYNQNLSMNSANESIEYIEKNFPFPIIEGSKSQRSNELNSYLRSDIGFGYILYDENIVLNYSEPVYMKLKLENQKEVIIKKELAKNEKFTIETKKLNTTETYSLIIIAKNKVDNIYSAVFSVLPENKSQNIKNKINDILKSNNSDYTKTFRILHVYLENNLYYNAFHFCYEVRKKYPDDRIMMSVQKTLTDYIDLYVKFDVSQNW